MECRWIVKALHQKAGLLMALDPRVAPVAEEVRVRTQTVLRSPTAHERLGTDLACIRRSCFVQTRPGGIGILAGRAETQFQGSPYYDVDFADARSTIGQMNISCGAGRGWA